MIEIGSWIGLAAMTHSEITIKDVSWENLGIIPDTFRKLGITLEKRGDDIFIPSQDSYEIQGYIDGSTLTVSDAPWPGFTPDLLSIVLVVCTQAKGSVLIHQKMFESRLFFVDKLIDMSISLSTKNNLLSNIFWCISTLPFAWVQTTNTILNKSGVNPGHGASETVKVEPSMYP